MQLKDHGNWSHGLNPGTDHDINCRACQADVPAPCTCELDAADVDALAHAYQHHGCPYACQPNDYDFCRYCGRDLREQR